MKIVYIKWADALSSNGTWQDQSEVDDFCKNENFIVDQVGYLIEKTDDYIVLAARYSKDGDIFMYGHLMKIPHPWILEYKELT